MKVESRHVRIRWQAHARTALAVVAPHAGRIEPVTGELAVAIAGSDHRLYCFSGRAHANNSRLHVTSTSFNERNLAEVLRGAWAVVSIHGSRGPAEPVTLVGGRNKDLGKRVSQSLIEVGFHVAQARAPLAGRHPGNITNRAVAGGVQLEISRVQRNTLQRERSLNHNPAQGVCTCDFCRFVDAVRTGMDRYAGRRPPVN